jgi:hypothetical protein
MFRRRRGEEQEPQGQEPAHGRYYIQKVKSDAIMRGSDTDLAAMQKELDAGAARGWVLMQAEFNHNAPTVLLWDTEPS